MPQDPFTDGAAQLAECGEKRITVRTSKWDEMGRGNSMFTFVLLGFMSSYQRKITTTTSFQYRD